MKIGEFDLPDAMGSDRHEETGVVRLSFHYDQEQTTEVFLDQSRLAQLLNEVHGKISQSAVTPISLDQLQPGKMIDVKALSHLPMSDGSLRIELLAQIDDRVVTVPFRLPPEGVSDLKNVLDKMDSKL